MTVYSRYGPYRVTDNNDEQVARFAKLATAHRFAVRRLDGGDPDVLTVEHRRGDGGWFPIRRISRLPFEQEITITDLAD